MNEGKVGDGGREGKKDEREVGRKEILFRGCGIQSKIFKGGAKTVEIKRPLQAREDRCFKNYPQGMIGGARVVFHQGQFRLHLPETSRNSQAQ